ncbi:MAG: hypothetical protein HY934_00660 [Candidatus Firestonebacteria bacterium]|nr:hypothetical protein [Candidatus Firestonebacteria bacterium]
MVFSDANAMYDKQAIKMLVRNFYDKRVGCVTGLMRYENPEVSNSGKGENSYWNYENFLRKFSSGIITGSIFALRRESYLPFDKFRGDDFELSMRCAINGYKVVFEEEAHSFEEVYGTAVQEFNRKVRVVSWNFESALLLLKEAFGKRKFNIFFKLISHKLLRWLISFFLFFLFISNLFCVFNYPQFMLLKLFFWGQIFFYFLALIGFFGDKFLSQKLTHIFWIPYYFCLINYAALVGIAKVFLKKTEPLWEVNR